MIWYTQGDEHEWSADEGDTEAKGEGCDGGRW